MPEKTKRKKDSEIAEGRHSDEQLEDDLEDVWSRDQQEKSYYYDDAYGYEIYNPDEEDESDEDN